MGFPTHIRISYVYSYLLTVETAHTAQSKKCTYVSHVTQTSPWHTFTSTILHYYTWRKRKVLACTYTHMYICRKQCVYSTYVHIYRGDFSPTLDTYSNCMGIFRLHNTSTETLTLSVWPLNSRVKKAHFLHTVYSAFRVSGPVCTLHTSITHVINILELHGDLTWIPIAIACETP